MKFDYYTYYLSEHFLPALMYNDRTGLDDQDEADLDAWIDALPVFGGHFDVISDEGDFMECEITRLHSTCHKVRLYFQTEEATK